MIFTMNVYYRFSYARNWELVKSIMGTKFRKSMFVYILKRDLDNGLFRKKKLTAGVWGHTFLKPALEFLVISFCAQNSRQNKSLLIGTPQNCVTLLGNFKAWTKILKPRPLEIPHYFLLDHPWEFHVVSN